MLLALKMGNEATSQGRQAASRSAVRKRREFYPRARGNQPSQSLDGTSNPLNYKITHVCGLQSLSCDHLLQQQWETHTAPITKVEDSNVGSRDCVGYRELYQGLCPPPLLTSLASEAPALVL